MAISESANAGIMVSWVVILLLFLIILPLIHVYLRIFKTEGRIQLNSDPTTFLRQHPGDVLVIASLCGLPGLLGLLLPDAASILVDTYAALLAGSVIIALFNTFYRVSYHLGALTILVIMSSIAWGPNYLALSIMLPVVAWAKYQTGEHTIRQLLSSQ